MKGNLQGSISLIRKNFLLILTTKNEGENEKKGRERSLFDKTFYNVKQREKFLSKNCYAAVKQL